MDLANLLEFWSGTARGWAQRGECALTAQNRFVIGYFVMRWNCVVDQSSVFRVSWALEIDCFNRRSCHIHCAKNPADNPRPMDVVFDAPEKGGETSVGLVLGLISHPIMSLKSGNIVVLWTSGTARSAIEATVWS
jgi:hypothetical protein